MKIIGGLNQFSAAANLTQGLNMSTVVHVTSLDYSLIGTHNFLSPQKDPRQWDTLYKYKAKVGVSNGE